MRVKLTPEQYEHAEAVGVARLAYVTHKKMQRPHGGALPADVRYIRGSLGEQAFALMIRQPWPAILGLDNGNDVAGFSVRTTNHDNGCLIVTKWDKAHHMCALVIQLSPREYRLAGCMLAGHAKQERFWRKRARVPAYFVPQRELSTLDEVTSRLAVA